MDLILQTNIFFYITSVAVILVTLLLVLVIFYVIAILRNIRDISDAAKKGTEILSNDLIEFRRNIKKDGVKTRHFINFFIQSIKPKRKRKTKE